MAPTHSSRNPSAAPFSQDRVVKDNLEAEQQGEDKQTRRGSEGQEGGLTEIAVPPPADRDETRKNSLEETEKRAEQIRTQSHGKPPSDKNAELTEVAAPHPVEQSQHGSDEEEGAESGQSAEDKSARSQKGQFEPLKSATELYTISWLIFFSFMGTLARLGIEAITTYPSAPWSSPVLWANLSGSLILGFLTEDRSIFRHEWNNETSKSYSFHPSKLKSGGSSSSSVGAAHAKVKKTIPLYIGLATGFCGSFTSFSSFIRDAFLALTNALPLPSATSSFHTQSANSITPRAGGFSFLATSAVLIVHPAVSLSAYHFGAHVALLLGPITPTLPFRLTRKILDPFAVFLALGCWIGSIILCVFPPSPHWASRVTFSLVFAPCGCLLRFYASRHLNARLPSFPLGTFAVNVFGTCVLGMCYDLQHARSIAAVPHGTYNACAVLVGVMEGFCGCCTTVSTWVAELSGLRRRHAYIYGIVSVGVALGFMVVIMGSVGWTIGFGEPICR